MSAILNLLQATVLADFFERRIFAPWFAMSERRGATVPSLMRSRAVRRVWNLLTAAFFAAVWWYLGTPAGRALLDHMAH